MSDERPPTPAPGAPILQVHIEPEQGRWWVVFVVTRAGLLDAPDEVHRHRIASYASERQARVAVKWMRGAADRPITSRHLNP